MAYKTLIDQYHSLLEERFGDVPETLLSDLEASLVKHYGEEQTLAPAKSKEDFEQHYPKFLAYLREQSEVELTEPLEGRRLGYVKDHRMIDCSGIIVSVYCDKIHIGDLKISPETDRFGFNGFVPGFRKEDTNFGYGVLPHWADKRPQRLDGHKFEHFP